MSIRLTREQIDAIGDLLFRCDACGGDGEVYRQGENDGQLFRVTLTPGSESFPSVEIDLCRDHIRKLRSFITWGIMFCQCTGIIESTGNTRPIEGGDGQWIEAKCEHFTFGGPGNHYHEWEPLD